MTYFDKFTEVYLKNSFLGKEEFNRTIGFLFPTLELEDFDDLDISDIEDIKSLSINLIYNIYNVPDFVGIYDIDIDEKSINAEILYYYKNLISLDKFISFLDTLIFDGWQIIEKECLIKKYKDLLKENDEDCLHKEALLRKIKDNASTEKLEEFLKSLTND